MERSIVVQEDIHHVNDMAGGQRGEMTRGYPCSGFPSVELFVVTHDSNFSIKGVETLTFAQKETRFVMVKGEDNIVLGDL